MTTRQAVAELARARGPLAAGSFRSVIFEADGRLSFHDHADLATARAHADDAASERWDGTVDAYVVDDRFEIVHTGEHYAER